MKRKYYDKKNVTRRDFIGKTAVGLAGIAVSSSGSSMSAASYKRIIGANDRINIGFLGCGARSMGHQRMVKTSEKEKNLAVVAVCDIWKLNREKAAANCKKLFGTDVKQFKYSEKSTRYSSFREIGSDYKNRTGLE
ncbi:MAG: twin-arginine translocation signal domain-containing protein [Bacteroidales bacterium]|nr:twin-arginine translocation signal domain-containing protein [Bacteroidales bacterium]